MDNSKSGPRQQQVEEAMASAQSVGLRYVTDEGPGYRRESAGKEFRYLDSKSRPIRDESVIKRIESLAIPPAWTSVWICPSDNGHLQATGRDDRGRKQHRYHPKWHEVRDETKYNRMVHFARALPKIRHQVSRDLSGQGLPRAKVLAAVVRLLEISLIRVGNDEYARENRSYGLTTMRDRHVSVNGSRITFQFLGKSKKEHEIQIESPALAKIVKGCQDLPGQELFQYVDANGKVQDVGSSDVNAYLREISGQDFTAKDFRTWAGTVLAAIALREFSKFDSHAEGRKNILRAIETVAARLGNTPSICRKCYIHPVILEAYLDGTLVSRLKQQAQTILTHGLKKLRPEEAAVLALLQQRLSQKKQPLEKLLKFELRRRSLKPVN